MTNRAARGERRKVGKKGIAKLKQAFIADKTMSFRRLASISVDIAGAEISEEALKQLARKDPDGSWIVIRDIPGVIICDECGHAITPSTGESSAGEMISDLARMLAEDIMSNYADSHNIEVGKVRLWLELIDRMGPIKSQSGDAYTIDDIISSIEGA